MKICLKCKRNLFDRDTQCDKCGCTDIMDKKEYDFLCDKFKSSTLKEQEQLRQKEEFKIICKYKFIIDPKNTAEKRREQSIYDKEQRRQQEKQYYNQIVEKKLYMQRKQTEQAKIEKQQGVLKCPKCGSTAVAIGEEDLILSRDF